MGRDDDRHNFDRMVSLFATYQFGVLAAILLVILLVLLFFLKG